MKKVLVFTIICMALLLLVPGVVSAADDVQNAVTDPTTASQSGDTIVKYGVSSMYYLVVPNDFTLGASTSKHAVVKITDARLPKYTMVNVTVQSENYNDQAGVGEPAWRMGHGGTVVLGGEYISYHLHSYDRTPQVDANGVVKDEYGNIVYIYSNGHKVEKNKVFLTAHAGSFSNGNGEVIKSLEFKIGDERYSQATYSGDYWDTLVFNAEIRNEDGSLYNPSTP